MNRYKSFLIGVFILVGLNAFSLVEKEQEDALNSYIKEIENIVSLSDYSSHETTINNALVLALDLGYDSTISNLYNAKSLYYLSVNSKEEALNNIDSAIFYAQKSNQKELIINAFNTKGFIYEHLFEFDKATKWLHKTLQLIDSIGTPKDKIAPLVNLSNIYIKNDENEKAITVLKEALLLSEKENDAWAILACTQSLGVVYSYLNNTSESEKQFKKLIVLAKKINRKGNEADAYSGLAHLFLKRNELDSAKVYYLKSFQIYRTLENHQHSYSPYLNLGKFYTKLHQQTQSEKDIEKAILYTDTAYTYAIKTGNLDGQQRSLLSLSELHQTANNYQLAYKNLTAYNLMRDSVFTLEKETIIKDYDAKYQLSKKENKIVKLNIENLKAETKADSFKYALIVGGGLFLILLFGIIGYNKYKKKLTLQKQQNKEHQQKIEFEKFKSNALIEKIDAAEIERDKISRELHDNIAGKLFVAKSKTSNSTEIANDLEGISVALRKLIANLSKPIFEDIVSVEESLNLFLNESLANTDIKYKLDIILESEYKMEEELKFDLYRISQELIMNVIKHSKATQIAVAILEENNKIELIVKDNGQGFKDNKTGHGYTNIAARLKKYKAQLRKTSNGGAEIIISFDL